jgi:hypothetical protein
MHQVSNESSGPAARDSLLVKSLPVTMPVSRGRTANAEPPAFTSASPPLTVIAVVSRSGSTSMR